MKSALTSLLKSDVPMIPAICSTVSRRLKRLFESSQSMELIVPVNEVYDVLRHKKTGPLDEVLGFASTSVLDALLCYSEQIGDILLMYDTNVSGSHQISLVILDPDWFCSEVLGELFGYTYSTSKTMIQDGNSLKQLCRSVISKGAMKESTVSLLPELLERMGLCSRMPVSDSSTNEFWLMTLMEHEKYIDACKLESTADNCRDFWDWCSFSRKESTVSICGRLISIEELLPVPTLRAQSFPAGTFARFQMTICNLFWRGLSGGEGLSLQVNPLCLGLSYFKNSKN